MVPPVSVPSGDAAGGKKDDVLGVSTAGVGSGRESVTGSDTRGPLAFSRRNPNIAALNLGLHLNACGRSHPGAGSGSLGCAAGAPADRQRAQLGKIGPEAADLVGAVGRTCDSKICCAAAPAASEEPNSARDDSFETCVDPRCYGTLARRLWLERVRETARDVQRGHERRFRVATPGW